MLIIIINNYLLCIMNDYDSSRKSNIHHIISESCFSFHSFHHPQSRTSIKVLWAFENLQSFLYKFCIIGYSAFSTQLCNYATADKYKHKLLIIGDKFIFQFFVIVFVIFQKYTNSFSGFFKSGCILSNKIKIPRIYLKR